VIPGLEYGVLAAAILAERWGLPGASTTAARALTDKLELRAAASTGGLRNPEWTQVRSPRDVRQFAQGGPLVLKPANRQASLGVQMLRAGDDIEAAWAFTVGARDDMLLPDRQLNWRYIAERQLTGREYSAEALVRRGTIIFTNVTGKIIADGRYPVEVGHVVPADLPGPVRERFAQAMARLVAAVGFDTGILHAEWMLDEQGPALIECAARMPGDSIGLLIDAAYGGSLVRSMVALLAGQEPAPPRAAAMAAAIRFITAQPGEVAAVSGLETAQRAFGVVRACVTVAPGDRVGELRSSWDRVGEVLAVGLDPAEAGARAAQSAAAIRVSVRDGASGAVAWRSRAISGALQPN
jgi:biotin carboxylase